MYQADDTPMILRDAEGQRVLGANRAALELLGWRPEELAQADGAAFARATGVAVTADPSWYVGGPAELLVARPDARAAEVLRLVERLAEALRRDPAPGDTTALLFVETEAGIDDELLAQRLRAVSRHHDLVARTAPGTYAVLCDHVRGEIEAAGLAAALVDHLAVFDARDGIAPRAVHVGLALAGDPGISQRELEQDALGALEIARTLGSARHAALTSAVVRRAHQYEAMTAALRRGLVNDEFVLHYQPVIDLSEGAAREVEALVRWAAPGQPLLPPDRFIPVAEQTGLIVELGDWVLRSACRFAAARPGLAVAVNVSARQVRSDLVLRVVAALDAAGLDASCLRLELTETAFLDDPAAAADVLRSLTELGVQLSLDDFGTGYASLQYLRRMPFDRLKIDRSFIRSLHDTAADRELVAAVLVVARAVGVRTTAEGVENEDQARILVDLGCEEAQGYYFGAPMPADTYDDWRLAFEAAAAT